MAHINYPFVAYKDQVYGEYYDQVYPVLIASVEEAEEAWGTTRAEWGIEDASDDDELIIVLRGKHCEIYLGEHKDLHIDNPSNSGIAMAVFFGINLDLVGLYQYWQEMGDDDVIAEFGLI